MPLVLAVAYLAGAIPFAVLVGRAIKGVDVRRTGSGNTGAMNTLRSAGLLAGALVALLDGGKGLLAVLAGRWLVSAEVGALAGCLAVTGHCFSPFLIWTARHAAWNDWRRVLRQTGGKGLATGMGVLFAIGWPVAIGALLIFAAVFALQRKDVTWPSVIGSLAAAPLMWYWTGNPVLAAAALLVGIVITLKHVPDLREGFWVEAQQ